MPLLLALLWCLAATPAKAAPIGAFVAAAIGATGFAATAISAVVQIGLSVGLSLVARALQPKPKRANSGMTATGTQVTVKEALASRRLVYGRARIGGTISYVVSTNNSLHLHLIVTLCEGPCDAVETVWFNDEAVTLDGSGNVTSGPYAGKARVKIHLGATDQAADADLIAESGGAWTANHRGRGVCYLYVRLAWDQTVAASGMPNITALVRGLKPFDPRTGLSVWTDNAALCIRDFMARPRRSGGAGAQSTDFDDGKWSAQANICDETVTTAGGGTEVRYTFNGVVELGDENAPQQTVQSMLTACGGRLTWAGGLWRVYVATWRASTFAIDDSMMRGPAQVQPRISRAQQFTAVKGSYVNPAARWQAADYPAVISTAFETEDAGERVYRDLPLPFTASAGMAQRLAKIELYRSRKQASVTLQCTLAAYGVTVGDTITVTHARWGWSDKAFEVTGWTWRVEQNENAASLGIDLTLRETASTVFDWSSTEEQLAQNQPSTTLPVWNVVDVPTGLGAVSNVFVSTAAEGTRSRTVVTWTAVDSQLIAGYDARYRVVDPVTGVDPTWTTLPRTADARAVIYDLPSGDYQFNVRAANAAGAVSAWATASVTITAVYKPPLVDVDSLKPGFLTEQVVNPLVDAAALELQQFAENVVRQSSVMTLTSQVGFTSASVTQQAVTVADLAGQTYGSWSVRIVSQAVTSGGTRRAITGFGLTQEGGGGAVTSDFAVYADRFFVLPSYSDPAVAATLRPVFVVGTTPDGAGVGINGNLFVDGSVAARSLAVTTLSAITANVGTVTAGVLRSTDSRFLQDLTNARIVISD